ncbi:hypothetical protein GGR50DRAFT_56021 [Xylaria sp. CBS 124048]|nr:hypothetical protein GGR50DRAFT_56021 [Xylaria sp. CBS 124048]
MKDMRVIFVCSDTLPVLLSLAQPLAVGRLRLFLFLYSSAQSVPPCNLHNPFPLLDLHEGSYTNQPTNQPTTCSPQSKKQKAKRKKKRKKKTFTHRKIQTAQTDQNHELVSWNSLACLLDYRLYIPT